MTDIKCRDCEYCFNIILNEMENEYVNKCQMRDGESYTDMLFPCDNFKSIPKYIKLLREKKWKLNVEIVFTVMV